MRTGPGVPEPAGPRAPRAVAREPLRRVPPREFPSSGLSRGVPHVSVELVDNLHGNPGTGAGAITAGEQVRDAGPPGARRAGRVLGRPVIADGRRGVLRGVARGARRSVRRAR